VATLLYVDDNSQRLQVLPARLELQGYEVLSAQDGAEALQIFAQKHVDLAVVDYYMPGMGGDILALEMKRTKPHVPVIIFSGTFTLREMVIAFVDGFISTADGVEPLLNRIAELLPQRRARRGRRISQDKSSAA
jgi:DNA-binding NtrC family response regulator